MAMLAPQAESQTYTLLAHITALAAHPTHAGEYKNFEATIVFEATDEWEAESIAAEIQESFYGEDGEKIAGLDPQDWVIYDVLGIEVRDAADCLLVNLDRYGNWQRTGASVVQTHHCSCRARGWEPNRREGDSVCVRCGGVVVEQQALDLPDWRNEEIDQEFGITNEDWQRYLRKSAYGYDDDDRRPDELDYTWGIGWMHGYGLLQQQEAIAAQIVAYCHERGYDIILKA